MQRLFLVLSCCLGPVIALAQQQPSYEERQCFTRLVTAPEGSSARTLREVQFGLENCKQVSDQLEARLQTERDFVTADSKPEVKASWQAFRERIEKVHDKYCERGGKPGCERLIKLYELESPKPSAEVKAKLEALRRKLASLDKPTPVPSPAASPSPPAQPTVATPPPAAAAQAGGADSPEARCLEGNDAKACYKLASGLNIPVQYLKRDLFLGNNKMEQGFITTRNRLLQFAVKGCLLNDQRSCGQVLSGISLYNGLETKLAKPMVAYEEGLKAADQLCKAGQERFCKVHASVKATGGKPLAEAVYDQDVAATLALLKQKRSLAGVDLSKKKLDGINLRYVDLTGANLRDARLKGADLSATKLDRATLDGSMAENANVQDASIRDGSARGATFAGGRGRFLSVKGTDFSDTYLGETLESTPDRFEAQLDGATIKRCQWKVMNLSGVKLRGVKLLGCAFNLSNLSEADFSGAEIFDTEFFRANLSRAKFDGAKMVGVSFVDSDLTGTSFVKVSAHGHGLSVDSNKLRGADFTEANLKDCSFKGILAGAIFDRATICGTGIEKVSGWDLASKAGARYKCQ